MVLEIHGSLPELCIVGPPDKPTALSSINLSRYRIVPPEASSNYSGKVFFVRRFFSFEGAEMVVGAQLLPGLCLGWGV